MRKRGRNIRNEIGLTKVRVTQMIFPGKIKHTLLSKDINFNHQSLWHQIIMEVKRYVLLDLIFVLDVMFIPERTVNR